MFLTRATISSPEVLPALSVVVFSLSIFFPAQSKVSSPLTCFLTELGIAPISQVVVMFSNIACLFLIKKFLSLSFFSPPIVETILS